MKQKAKKALALFLTLVMSMSLLSISSFAKNTPTSDEQEMIDAVVAFNDYTATNNIIAPNASFAQLTGDGLVVNGGDVTLEGGAVFSTTPVTALDDNTEFWGKWEAEFVMIPSQNIPSGTMKAYGQYDEFGKDWVGIDPGANIAAGSTIRVIKDALGVYFKDMIADFYEREVNELNGIPFAYVAYAVKTFQCGLNVEDFTELVPDTSVDLELRLYAPRGLNDDEIAAVGAIKGVNLKYDSELKRHYLLIGETNTFNFPVSDDYVARVGGTNYKTLEAAIEAANDGDTITLLKDVTYGTDHVVAVWEKDFNLDLNGHTFTTDSNQSITLNNNGYKATAICFGDDTKANPARAISISNGTIRTAFGAGVYLDGAVTATLSDLDVKQNYPANVQATDEYSTAIRLTTNATVIVNSGSYEGRYAIVVSNSGGTVTVNDGTFTGGIYFSTSTNSNVTKSITINGGTFHKHNNEALFENLTCGTLTITGGTFDADPSNYVASGYEAYDNGDGTWTVATEGAVAQIGTARYTTLAAAIAAVPTDGTKTTITMTGDTTEASNTTINIAATKNIVLDLNGHTISSSAATKSARFIKNEGTLTVRDTSTNADGKITFYTTDPDTSYQNENITIYNLDGLLTLQSGKIENTSNGGATYAVNNSSNAWGKGDDKETVFNMTGGVVSAPSGDAALRVYQNCAQNNDPYSHNTVNISGGTILDTGIFLDNNIYQATSQTTGEGILIDINITGGTINGLIDLKLRHAFNTSLDITGGDFTNAKLWVRKKADSSHVWGVQGEPTSPIVTISGGKWSFATGMAFGLEYECNGTSWTSYTKPYSVSGGVFNVDLNTFSSIAFPTGQTGVANTDSATMGNYPYTVGARGFYEENGVYHINSLAGLKEFRDRVNGNSTYTADNFAGKTVQLDDDIDLTGETWEPIGAGLRKNYAGNVSSELSSDPYFAGTFDGQNHTISGLSSAGYELPSADEKKDAVYGLFGTIGNGAVIKNVKLDDVEINLEDCDTAGALVGYAFGTATVDNVSVSGSVTAHDAAGGIVGRAYYGNYEDHVARTLTLTNCSGTATVTCANEDTVKCGGLFGFIADNNKPDYTIVITGNSFGGSVTNGASIANVGWPMYNKDGTRKYPTEGDRIEGNLVGTQPARLGGVAKIGNVEYTTLEAAIEAAEDGDTITLIADVTKIADITSGGVYTIGKSLTIDGQNHTVTVAGSGKGYAFNFTDEAAAKALNCTIQNMVLSTTGYQVAILLNGDYYSTLNVNHVNVTCDGECIYSNGHETVNATNCVFTHDGQYAENKDPVYYSALIVGYGGDIVVENCSVTSFGNGAATFPSGGSVTMTNTNISIDEASSVNENAGYAMWARNEDYTNLPEYCEDSVITFNSGNVVGAFGITDKYKAGDASNRYESKIVITGGKFDHDPTAYVATGHEVGEISETSYRYKVEKSAGTATVTNDNNEINEYASVSAAVAAVVDKNNAVNSITTTADATVGSVTIGTGSTIQKTETVQETVDTVTVQEVQITKEDTTTYAYAVTKGSGTTLATAEVGTGMDSSKKASEYVPSVQQKLAQALDAATNIADASSNTEVDMKLNVVSVSTDTAEGEHLSYNVVLEATVTVIENGEQVASTTSTVDDADIKDGAAFDVKLFVGIAYAGKIIEVIHYEDSSRAVKKETLYGTVDPQGYVTVTTTQKFSTFAIRLPSATVGAVNLAMELDQDLNLIFQLEELPDGAKSYKLSLPRRGNTTTYDVTGNVPTAKTHGYYEFTYAVPAQYVRDDLEFTIYDNSDKVIPFSIGVGTYKASIEDYLNRVVTDLPTDTTLATLTKALFDYGDYAKVYFAKDDPASVTPKQVFPEGADKATPFNNDYATSTSRGDSIGNTDLTYYGASLVLLSNLHAKLYFKMPANSSEQNINSYGFSVDNESAAVSYQKSGNTNYLIVSLPGVSPDKLDDAQTITIGDWSMKYSAYHYARSIMNSSTTDSDSAIAYLLYALYLYNEAAEDYVTNHPGT